MKTAILTLAAAAVAAAALPAHAADDAQLERLATCRDSWFEWRADPARMAGLAGFIETNFSRGSDPGGYAPASRMTVLGGQRVAQVFPQSVGMGVGFSVVVDAPFVRVRQLVEKQLGKPLACESGDGMRGCELKLAEKKSLVLMAPEAASSTQTLLGCYYFYEK